MQTFRRGRQMGGAMRRGFPEALIKDYDMAHIRVLTSFTKGETSGVVTLTFAEDIECRGSDQVRFRPRVSHGTFPPGTREPETFGKNHLRDYTGAVITPATLLAWDKINEMPWPMWPMIYTRSTDPLLLC